MVDTSWGSGVTEEGGGLTRKCLLGFHSKDWCFVSVFPTPEVPVLSWGTVFPASLSESALTWTEHLQQGAVCSAGCVVGVSLFQIPGSEVTGSGGKHRDTPKRADT